MVCIKWNRNIHLFQNNKWLGTVFHILSNIMYIKSLYYQLSILLFFNRFGFCNSLQHFRICMMNIISIYTFLIKITVNTHQLRFLLTFYWMIPFLFFERLILQDNFQEKLPIYVLKVNNIYNSYLLSIIIIQYTIKELIFKISKFDSF